jgi:glycosyltransferase involved in cell wall biosynthesis
MSDQDRPRVLQVITHLGLGGAEAVAIDICRGLHPGQVAGLFCVRAGVHDDVGAAWRDELLGDGLPVFSGSALPVKRGGLLHAAQRLAATIRDLRPDVVHVHTEIPEATLALASPFAPRGTTARLLRTIHNSTLWPRWRGIAVWTERRFTNVPVAAVSRSAVDGLTVLRRALGLRPVEDRLTRLIYDGRPIPNRIRSEAPRDTTLRVLFAGRFELQKGADLVPEVLRRLEPSLAASLRVTLAGSGSLAQTLRDALPRLRILAETEIIEPIPTLSDRLVEYDMIIMPSRFEGLGLLAIEAALAGVTLVITDAAGLNETVPPDHPWIAPAGDAAAFAEVMARAIRDRERWPSVNAAAMAYAECNFQLSVMQRAYRTFYADVASGRLHQT